LCGVGFVRLGGGGIGVGVGIGGIGRVDRFGGGRGGWQVFAEADGIGDKVGPGFLESGFIFLLGELMGLEHEVAEISEGVGGFGFDMAEGGGAEKLGEGNAEIARGVDVDGEGVADLLASVLLVETLDVLLVMEIAQAILAGGSREHGAAAAVGKSEDAEIVGIVRGSGHRDSRFDFFRAWRPKGKQVARAESARGIGEAPR